MVFLPHHRFKGFIKGKVLPGCGRKKAPSDSITFLSLFLFCVCITYVFCFQVLSQSSYLCFCCLICFCCFVFHIKIKKKIEKSEKYKNSVCFVYIGTCLPWIAIETKFSKLCIICCLDEHLYAQLSKWALWLLFVISKIKLSLVLNTRITLFDEND